MKITRAICVVAALSAGANIVTAEPITIPEGKTVIITPTGQSTVETVAPPAVVTPAPEVVTPAPSAVVTPPAVVEPAGQTTVYAEPWYHRFAYAEGEDLFRANEMSLDFFGSYKHGENGSVGDIFDDFDKGGTWGGGVGANYFFLKWLGVGADVTMHADGGKFIDSASASLIARLPLDAVHLAPYGFIGGGGNFDPTEEWTAQAGAGLEFRLNPHTGIFSDIRYVWADKTSDNALARAGLRFVF